MPERTWIYFHLVARNFFNDGIEVKGFLINTPINNFKSSMLYSKGINFALHAVNL